MWRFEWSSALAVLLSAFAAGCGASDEDLGAGEGALRADSRPLADEDFKGALDKPFIQGTHAIAADAFETKWTASRSVGPFMFFRAYPAAYHKDFATNLEASAIAKIPSGTGLCLGDPHPDNFGFLELDGKTLYAYNDLDDSGRCRVAIDALRYLTAVRLYGDKDLTETAAKRYVKVLSGETDEADARKDVAKVRDEHAPNFAKRHKSRLEEAAPGGKLALGEGMAAVPAATRKAVVEAIQRSLPQASVLDVVAVEREAGGSGGLARFWVLTGGDAGTILELKEVATPGVDFGLDAKTMKEATRLASLKNDLWGVTSTSDYVYAKLFGKTFLLRDRLAKASLDLTKLKPKELKDVIEAQAGIVALLHKSSLKVANEDEAKALRHWLEDSSDVLARRWKRAYE